MDQSLRLEFGRDAIGLELPGYPRGSDGELDLLLVHTMWLLLCRQIVDVALLGLLSKIEHG